MPKKPQPTDAVPGSVEKIAVLARRAKLGQDLFVRGDADGYVDRDSERYAVSESQNWHSQIVRDEAAFERQKKREKLDEEFRLELNALLRNGGRISEVTQLRSNYFRKLAKREIGV